MKLKMKNVTTGAINGLAVAGGVIGGKKLRDAVGSTLPSIGDIRLADVIMLVGGGMMSASQKGAMQYLLLGVAGAGALGIAETQFGITGSGSDALFGVKEDTEYLAAYISEPGYYENIAAGESEGLYKPKHV